MLLTILLSVGATLVVVAVVYNLFDRSERRLERRLSRQYGVEDPLFLRELSVLLGPPMVGGNLYVAPRNGDEIFPAMLDGIRGARSTISFESYIYWAGEIGRQFADVLAERAQSGVAVHVLLDWMGSAKIDASILETMQRAGVDVRRYHPVRWYTVGKMNNRTHRKLLIIDGTLGFTGGVGIAPEWTGHAQDPDHWRDTHFRIEGPVVGQLQSVFLDNWIKVAGEVPHGIDYFPPLDDRGEGLAQVFSSSPSGGSESMQLMYLLAITAASRTIDLSAAYFVPDRLSSGALVAALQRGVKVRVVLPGEHIDSETSRSASRATWGPILQAGALIAEYGPTMYHCKVMIVDGLFTSVGSTNFDNRSFYLNDEATLNLFDAAFAREQTATFEEDFALSKVVTYEAWLHRPWRERAADRIASMIGSQL